MTNKEVRELLEEYDSARRNVDLKKALLERAKADYNYIKTTQYDKEKVDGGGPKDSVVEKAAFRVIELEAEYIQACDKMFILEDKIADILPLLDAMEQNLVIDRFMNNLEMPKLSNKYFYTPDSLKNKYTKIYKKIAKK